MKLPFSRFGIFAEMMKTERLYCPLTHVGWEFRNSLDIMTTAIFLRRNFGCTVFSELASLITNTPLQNDLFDL